MSKISENAVFQSDCLGLMDWHNAQFTGYYNGVANGANVLRGKAMINGLALDPKVVIQAAIAAHDVNGSCSTDYDHYWCPIALAELGALVSEIVKNYPEDASADAYEFIERNNKSASAV